MGKPRSYKSFDANALFQMLRDGAVHTRRGLVHATGLSRSTIDKRIDELIARGLISEVPSNSASLGRPSMGFALNAEARVIVAADMGMTRYAIAITDLVGRVLVRRDGRYAVADGPEATLDLIVRISNDLLAECGRDPEDVAAVGIGLPVPVIHDRGATINPTNMPMWEGYSVPAHIRRTFDVPVLADNDANIMVLGERTLNWPDVDDFMLIKASTGIGSGIISNGLLQRGADGTAGSIGHIPVTRAQGIACTCGNDGCLTAVAGGAAIAASLRAACLPTETIQDVVDLARAGDLAATRALRQAGRDIGEVVSMSISLINPSVIAIAGLLADAGEYVLAGVREAVFGMSTPMGSGNVTVTLADRHEIGLYGASMLAIEHALADEGFVLLERAATARL